MITNREPLVPIEWGQGNPYNAFVKYKSNCTDAPVGCVATATAQIMAYWQYPWEIDGQSIRWNELIKYTGRESFVLRGHLNPNWVDEIRNASPDLKANVAHLMERIGYHVGMNYGCFGSSASISDATAFLRNRGYKGGFRNDYEVNAVINSLNYSHPLILEGCAIKKRKKILGIKGKSSYSVCHAWVVDGYKNFRREIKQITEIRDQRTNRLMAIRTDYFHQYFKVLHNNWGWDGVANGWFQAGVFDSGSYNFQYRNRIYPHIRRYKY
ncbi:C10 family peptidase [Flavobacterium sp. JP2137]|uniref:C10 family peptidase n=1 Tax=Flavobacterium sp. JP2137 TaxID=3414510 RepID=UPI003D2FC42C